MMHSTTLSARVTGGALALMLAASVASGQALDRSKRPVAPPAAPYKFPNVGTKALSNGIPVAIVENHDLPIVAVRVVFEGGSRLDPVGKEGLYQLVNVMLREGTATMTADQLAEAFSDLGNTVAPTGFTTIGRNVDRSLELMADLLMHPAFPQASFDRQKANIVANLSRAKDQPAFVAQRVMANVLYGAGHPYERSPTEASLGSISRDDLVRFHSQYFRPENVKLVVAGDVTPATILPKLEKALGKWEKGGARTVADVAAPKGVAATTIYLFDRPNSPQSSVMVAQLGPTRSVDDFYALETMTTVFSALSGSRLQQNLRERHAYTYDARGGFTWRRAPEVSTFTASSDIVAPKTDSALIEWMHEIRDIRGARPPSDSEMAFARTNRVASLPAQMEALDAIANRVGTMLQDNLPFNYYDQYIARISKLSAGDVAAVAQKYVDPEHLAIVIVGDRKVIEPGLRAAKIAPIVMVDENGKPVVTP